MTLREDRIAELLVPFLQGSALSTAQLERLRAYLDLLLKWNSKLCLNFVYHQPIRMRLEQQLHYSKSRLSTHRGKHVGVFHNPIRAIVHILIIAELWLKVKPDSRFDRLFPTGIPLWLP